MRVTATIMTALRALTRLVADAPQRRPEIERVRARLADTIFVVLGVFSGIPVALGAMRAVREGESGYAAGYVAALLVLLAGVALRRWLPYPVKAWLLLGVVDFWGIASMLRLGFTGIGFMILTSAVVLAAPLRGPRGALGALVFGGLAIAAIGSMHLTGIVPVDPNTITTILRPSAWVNAGLVFVLFAVMLTMASQLLMRRLEDSLSAVEAHAAELDGARAALEESETRFRTLAELLPEVVFETDLEGRFTYVNRAGFETFGYEDGVMPPGASVWDMVDPQDRDAVRQAIVRIAGGGRSGLSEYRGVRRDGTQFPVLVTTAAVRVGGEMVGMRGIVVDISEKKSVEAQLRQAQNLETVGRLAAGVAHDFNNILVGIRGRVALARDPARRAELEAQLQHIDAYVDSAAHLTRQLVAFGRGGGYETRSVNVSELAERTVKLFGRTQKRLSLQTTLEKRIWTVTADPGQLEQVLLNLLLNAEQATPTTGVIEVTTRNVVVDVERAAGLQMEAGDCVALEVGDTGVGIAPDNLPRIFDPFFSTKDAATGSGLGLASAYGIVRGHHGAIEVESALGRGTRFTVLLPATSRETAKAAPRSVSQPTRGTETVLVVDDEEVVLGVTEPLLEQLGYAVVTARSGEEALDVVAREKEAFALVLLDMVMPKMSGLETFRKLRRLQPDLRVLALSGYSDSAEARELLREPGVGFLAKPYRLADLATKIREMLESDATPSAKA